LDISTVHAGIFRATSKHIQKSHGLHPKAHNNCSNST